MKNTIGVCVLVCALWLLSLDAAWGANAAFSVDGKAVFIVNDDPIAPIEQIDIATGTVTPIKVQLGKDDIVAGIALAPNGNFYLVTKQALWRWKSGTAKTKWIASAPDKVSFTDIACHVKSGDLLISAQAQSKSLFYCRHDNRKQLTRVGIRYPPGESMASPVFLPDGSFLFSADGDLWHGIIAHTSEREDHPVSELIAYRYAPMAQRETYEGSPSETGILGIAVSTNKVYVHFGRMMGSGWGRIQRLNVPRQEPGKWKSNNSSGSYVRALQSIEKMAIATCGGVVYLGGSIDGQRVYYGSNLNNSQRHDYLLNDNSTEAEPLREGNSETIANP